MSQIKLSPLGHLNTAEQRPFPFGTTASDWRPLTPEETATLERNGNQADNWANIQVAEGFSAHRVQQCRFYGLVRIGAIPEVCLEYHELALPAGLYSSTIINCDINSQTAIHKVHYMSRVSVDSQCILFNIDEIITTNHAKFGNGVLMDEEDEKSRIWLEIANENTGRQVLPFNGMLPADAWLWSKYRDNEALMQRFFHMTTASCAPPPGAMGHIGSNCVIKNSRSIKDVRIGESAYLKGCNKLKNLTINSDASRPTQLGEGCELVNGIIGYGCRIFYGVKAVRFVLCGHSSLKYGARLLNSVLGPNSTISCCEVLNSLIFGSHEQHHNSSFLCASVLKGQSNMASAATVGSNHNSRASDGEIIADRGFWPGLSVSLKHNSRFAAFCLIAKGAYPAELNVPLPFTLIANNEHSGELTLMPGYWFRYNMYALARNSAKTALRDKRAGNCQSLEYDWLAPDTVQQMLEARRILEQWAEESPDFAQSGYSSGAALLQAEDHRPLYAGPSCPIENSRRPVRIRHAGQAWKDYGRFIRYWCVRETATSPACPAPPESGSPESAPLEAGPLPEWENLGGQLIEKTDLEKLKNQVISGELNSWQELHSAYRKLGESCKSSKLRYARQILRQTAGDKTNIQLTEEARETARFILEGIRQSRKKDYDNFFRNITFSNSSERDTVLGKYEENSFIQDAEEAHGKILSQLENSVIL